MVNKTTEQYIKNLAALMTVAHRRGGGGGGCSNCSEALMKSDFKSGRFPLIGAAEVTAFVNVGYPEHKNCLLFRVTCTCRAAD
jgi:hypothetical protein